MRIGITFVRGTLQDPGYPVLRSSAEWFAAGLITLGESAVAGRGAHPHATSLPK